MGFVQRSNNGRASRPTRIRIRTDDSLGYITTSAIDSLVAKVTQQSAPSPTTTTASVYTTPTSGPTLVAPSPIAPPSSPPIVYTAPVQSPPVQASPMPPTTFTPPTTGVDQPPPPPPPPSSGGTSSSGGSAITPYAGGPVVDIAPPSSGFLPETDTPPSAAPAPSQSLADQIAALPIGVKIGAALALFFFLKKAR